MASPSYTEDLLEKIRTLPDDKIAEVADFVEFLHARSLQQVAPALDELEAQAVAAGLLRLRDAQAARIGTSHPSGSVQINVLPLT